MASARQVKAAKRNIRKAQARWRTMTKTERARSQPQGRGRKGPVATGRGR